jgi:exopolyphosphatase/guanosine-5'-triphosphate,3'-diphosphate pyrophosphatase
MAIEKTSTESAGAPVAVIDIGSNSARVVVYAQEPGGQLRMVAGTRAPLRLVRDLEQSGKFSKESIELALDAIRDFRAMALGAGATRIVAVATAAMREAQNGAALIERVRRDLGIEVRVIAGVEEAEYGFLGALRGLPLEHGVLFDLGGGSMQVSRFRHRRLVDARSFPLGALRLSVDFLRTDPPSGRELRKLREHVRETLEKAGVARVSPGEQLVGTGGTVRNLAKIDRRSRSYPITRLHGYVLERRRIRDIVSRLAVRRLKSRSGVAGLNDDRGDSIVGGALAIQILVELVGAESIHVSGQGVREGLAYSLLSAGLPSTGAVREASLAALTGRFGAWDAAAAARRTAVAGALVRLLEPSADPEFQDAVLHAARLLDIGRSVDFFDRHQHVADIVVATELNGFSHREIALLAAILRTAGDRSASVKAYGPLLRADEGPAVERAALLLILADDIEERCPRGASIQLEGEVRKREVVLRVPALAGWRPRGLAPRFQKAFGRSLEVTSARRG